MTAPQAPQATVQPITPAHATTAPAAAAPVPAKPAPDPAAEANKKYLAQYARKERELQATKESFRKEQEAFRAERESSASSTAAERAKWAEMEKMVARGRLDPMAAMEKLFGVTYDDLTEARLNGKTPAGLEAKHALKELDDFKAQIAEEKRLVQEERQRAEAEGRTKTEAQQRAEEKETADFLRRDVRDFVAREPDKYEAINAFGAHDLVAQAMQREWVASGTYLQYGEAADRVEAQLREEALKLEGQKWYKARSEGAKQPTASALPPPGQTLTNDLTPGTAPAQKRRRSDQERIDAGIAAAKAVEAATSARRRQ